MPSPKKPNCPVCKTNRHVRPIPWQLFFCTGCKGTFDDNPEEGGTCHADPVRSLERKEKISHGRHR